ncbi:MAG: hypothetical protein ABID40_01185, partial [Candidatus Bipolaricaulota bacterium]
PDSDDTPEVVLLCVARRLGAERLTIRCADDLALDPAEVLRRIDARLCDLDVAYLRLIDEPE